MTHSLDRPLVLLLVFGLALPLAGQTVAQRKELGAFRDSLSGVSDVQALVAHEASLIAEARQSRNDAMLHLRLGFVALRLGELTDDLEARKHYDDAGGEFEWAIEVQPTWPVPWYGLGRAEMGVGNSEHALVKGIQTMLGKDALSRSANAFARSAEVDPGFVDGLVELSNTALKQRINSRMDVALAALRRAGRTDAAMKPAVLLSRGRIERVGGSLDSSAVSLRDLLAQDSTNSTAWFELARTLLLKHDPAAPDFWYRGLASADSGTLAMYREDMATIMPDSMLDKFDGASVSARVQLVRNFWHSRDADELHSPGDRLAEHYRRLDFARRNFRLVSESRQFGISERYRSGQTEYDDRGIIYIKHGEPDDKAQYNAPGIEPNESWLYRREGHNLLFHFVARQDVQDYRLVESLFDILPFEATVALMDEERLREDPFSGELRRHTDGLLRSREGMDPIYSRLLGSGRAGNSKLLAEERAAGAAAIKLGTKGDSWPIEVGEPIDATLDVIAVGSDAAGAQIQFAFAIGGADATPRDIPEGFAYPVRTRIGILALDGTVVAKVDTTRTFLYRKPIEVGQLLMGRLPVRVPPGTFTVRMAIQTDDGGLVTNRDTVRVASPLGPDAGLSDLAIGAKTIPLTWSIGGTDSAWINPTRRFDRSVPMQLYFEVTGLPPGTPYQIEISVKKAGGRSIFKRIFGGSGTAFKLAFDQTSRGGVDRIARELDLREVSEGKYSVQVVVRSENGYEISRVKAFEVFK